MLLVLLGDGAVANVLLRKSKGQEGGWIVIATGWGFAVAMALYVIGWISGGHVNPAVTLSFVFMGKTPWSEVPFYFSGQFLGAFIGACFVYLTYKVHYDQTNKPENILMTFCTKAAVINPIWNFITELIATAILLVGICGILNSHNHLSEGLAPYLVGVLVFSIGLSLGGPTGYAINPARDLGPRIAHALLPIPHKGSSDWRYAWIPFFAPFIGGILGVCIYQLFAKTFFT